jgi:hypothetical protein
MWSVLVTLAMAAPARIAIISDAGSKDLSTLVTTELSSNDGVVLVERDDLAKIGDEAKVQQMAGSDATALGKLANADGLLFLDQRADGMHVRLTAVNLGYALFDDPVPSAFGPQQAAKALAHLVADDAPKLKLDPEKAVPISLLNLRADMGAPAALELERNLTLLLESKLAAVPEFVVLERRHAWSLGFEHSLDPVAKPLLKGAYLVDGTISMDASGTNCSIALRLRQPGGGQEKAATLQCSTKDTGAIADQILAAIKKDLGRTVSESAANATVEANEYLQEALWGWRSNVPNAALEAVDSSELLGAARSTVIGLRIQILCALAGQGMDSWNPPDNPIAPVFDDNTLSLKTDAVFRAIGDAISYRDEKLESQIQDFVPPNGTDRFYLRTGETTAKVAFTSSQVLVLLERANSARAHELRLRLRALSGYDPFHGQAGVMVANSGYNNGNSAVAFADDWAETLEEELAFYRLEFADTEFRSPLNVLHEPSRYFCARFLTTPEARSKAFGDFVESLKDYPQSHRLYLVLKTSDSNTGVADNAYRAYLDYIWPMRDRIASTDNYESVFGDYWRMNDQVETRNMKAALPLLHAILKAPKPGQWAVDTLKMLCHPEGVDAADAPLLWTEIEAYTKRRNDEVIQQSGRSDEGFIAEMDQFKEALRNKFPEVAKIPAAAPDVNSATPLVVTQFWHPWLAATTPTDNNVIITGTSVGKDEIWIAGYLNLLEKGRFFKVHLPDLKTETLDAMDGKYIQGMLWTSDALYATLGSDVSLPGGFKHLLARYDFSASSWSSHDLPVSYSQQYLFEANGDIYLPTGTRSGVLGQSESGLVKYNWDKDKITLLADSRRRPAQNQFDDTASYRIISVFVGSGNKPCVTTDSGTYLIQESSGTWPPLFDGRFNDSVVTENGQSLVFNAMGEAMFIDPKSPSPIPWMAADEPIYRHPKGQPGVTGPVPTPWASQTIWDCPPDKKKQMDERTVAFHEGRLFILFKPSPIENRYELLCYDKTRGRKPVHIPLKMELTEAAKAVLSQHPGRMPNGWTLDEIEQPHPPFEPQLIATSQGLCLDLRIAGFWFIPYADIEGYLKSLPKPDPTVSISPKPSLTSLQTNAFNELDPGDPTSFR